MSITPMSPALIKQGWVQTWVTSQWKNPSIPGQFSAEVNTLEAMTVVAPFQRRKRGVGARLVIGEQAPASHDAVLIRNIARAHRYYEAITQGSTFEELAETENLTVRRILQVIELAFIAPDIVKGIVRGEQPSGLTAKWLGQNPLPSAWHTQRRVVAAL